MEETVPNNSALFANEHSVLEALVLVRSAPIATEDKALIRDLFLDYVASEGDDNLSLKQEIISKLKNTEGVPKDLLKLIPANPETVISQQKEGDQVKQVTSDNRLGHVRPSLSFSPASATDDTVATEEMPVSAEDATSSIENSAAPKKEEKTDVSTEEPEVRPDIPNDETTDVSDSEPAPSPAPEVQTQPKPASSSEDAKSRINTIKHDINTAVGNPVNLISMDAAIGREYMSSLLEAMKSVSSGSVATSELARLETAYAEAKKLIEKSGDSLVAEKSEKPEQARTAEPTPEPAKSQPIPDTPTKQDQEPVTEASEQSANPEPKSNQTTGLYHRPEDEVQEDVKNENEESSIKEDATEKRSALANLATGLWTKKDKKTSSKDDQDTREYKPTSTPLTTPLEKSTVRKVGVVGEDEVNENADQKEEKTADTRKEEGKPKPPVTEGSTLKPISTATSLPEKMSEVQKAAKKAEEERSKPITDLKSPEVTAGLEQLLSEWKLFKKSGMFGTGPKGINHPLYKKLADQPMAVVVAGRFEGSTPDIKQSLTSYMNGWRYEQGIIHEMGETFETYLRRVILRILQNNRNSTKTQ